MHGVGKTIFQGNKIEDFQVEILGVLENVGPKQSLIIARISGGPLEHTGVMQGMSGSPVYIDGKLIGALAMAFPFSKDPIAAIRPIAEMLPVANESPATRPNTTPPSSNLLAALPRTETINGQMIEIATPISFGGFTQGTIDYFAPRLKALGLEPRQGIGLGGKVDNKMGDPSALHPGSMISVQLMTGDLGVGADGTVTHIDGDKVYAFGHRFMAVGPTGIPFTRSEVIALLPNLNSSFKISTPRELMGVISQDRSTAIAGVLGKRGNLMPVEISVNRGGKPVETYHLNIVNDRYLSPVLLQMAVFSTIDATERGAGSSSVSVNGEIQLDSRPSVPVAGSYSGEANIALQASLAPSLPLAYLMQGGFSDLRIRGIVLRIDSADTQKQFTIEEVTASRKEVRPGESVEITTRLTGENGTEILKTVKYEVPIGASPGTLFFSVADGPQTSIADLRSSYGSTARTFGQLIDTLKKLRANDKAYLRVWRSDPNYQVSGEDMPDPPPSVALILGATSNNPAVKNSKVQEFVIDATGTVVSGAKTVQVEVRS
jgi:SpoIVB peptidase S55